MRNQQPSSGVGTIIKNVDTRTEVSTSSAWVLMEERKNIKLDCFSNNLMKAFLQRCKKGVGKVIAGDFRSGPCHPQDWRMFNETKRLVRRRASTSSCRF